MGLMYMFPTEKEDSDRIEFIKNKSDNSDMIILKTYGLPMIFWGYLTTALVVIGTMWLASNSVIEKLLSYNDSGLTALAYLVRFTLILTPVVLIGFFFYEKQIHKNKNELILVFKVFSITLYKKKITIDKSDSLEVNHYLDSPNMAKIYHKEELKHFENKGYFELKAIANGNKILIDRHSRKIDLIKLKDLLAQY